MTTEEISRFVEFMTYTHCSVRLYDKLYWCLSVCMYHENGLLTIRVMEADPVTHEGGRDVLLFRSFSADECMNHFLEDKYWDGKSFYEVAPDVEWIDL